MRGDANARQPLCLGRATQKCQGALGVFDEFPLFVMVTIVLQIPQTTVNCRFSGIHLLTDVLLFQLKNSRSV